MYCVARAAALLWANACYGLWKHKAYLHVKGLSHMSHILLSGIASEYAHDVKYRLSGIWMRAHLSIKASTNKLGL